MLRHIIILFLVLKITQYFEAVVIKNINVTPELKKEVSDRFDATRLLARLGHRAFSYLVEDEDLDPAEVYDPLNYGDANY